MNSRRNFLKSSVLISSALAFPKFVFSTFSNNLPNVLILGDSISIGYTPFVKDLLKYKANVFRPMLDNEKAENCSGTTKGVDNIDRWIGTTKWDVIHFNFGLHDIKHVDPVTGENSKNPDHPHQADVKQYRKNLKVIVEKLKATGAKLIFATTTPYPDEVGGPLRKPGMPEKYNKAAIKIMNFNGIAINNLYEFVKPRIADLQLPNNVHFKPQGSLALAEKVIDRINEALEN
ncbi:MAG: SGNH/GDSL hydrolase family protein [Prolixibacteraceae bacterium]|jgi:lysophospholipase L1-like esterase|nr:SGNH/GDSL hydrolase family protein [Prolixibacteraceae bacterium]MBT6766579.1 SGNH/GDSL hydrolase family protein [Prolixibacteraceae bacterium]MBT7000751.1 SGNH/GDSL hydrolase family protein [Prolixibacteraceae bacterium]MBT7394873.1 SGNH/GDSL hydrolase family protein [Prolixibacteraceae bacterium]